MTYTEWIIQVVRHIQTYCGCGPAEADLRVDNAMNAKEYPWTDSWAYRWYQVRLTPIQGAHRCCALAWGWKPKGALESPFDPLSESVG